MSLRNTKYMQGPEFKSRQGAFAFFCAKAAEYLAEFRQSCIQGWKELFRREQKGAQMEQLSLDLEEARKAAAKKPERYSPTFFQDWWKWDAEKNGELF